MKYSIHALRDDDVVLQGVVGTHDHEAILTEPAGVIEVAARTKMRRKSAPLVRMLCVAAML